MPESGKGQSGEWGWTLSQRRALLLLVSLFFLALIVRLSVNRRFVPADPGPGERGRELASRLDPNSADWQALAAIPNLGEKRAKDIVTYRDRVRGGRTAVVVFKTVYDLRVIRGIGPAMVEKLRPYLIFPGESPASLPVATEDQDVPQ